MRMMQHSLDTDPKVEAQRLELLGTLTPEERFMRMNRLCAFGTLAMLEGIREKFPQLSESELHILLARRLWGDNFADHIARKREIER